MYHGGQCLFEKHMELLRIQFQSCRYKALFLFWLMFSLQTSIVTVTVKGKKWKRMQGTTPRPTTSHPGQYSASSVSTAHVETWARTTVRVNYFISCTGVLDSWVLLYFFVQHAVFRKKTFFFWGAGGVIILVKLLLFTLMNDRRW